MVCISPEKTEAVVISSSDSKMSG